MEQKHILVVEDEAPFQLFLQKLLQNAGYRVSAVPEGRAAIKRAREDRPDLVLLDLIMPGMDGYATCSMLKRADRRAAPVLVLSGRTTDKDEKAAYAAGADAFLRKPVDGDVLLERIRNLLEPKG